MSSNLPPGVSASMIPGNRPEDEDDERFWDALYQHAEGAGLSAERVEAILDQPDAVQLLESVRHLAREAGYTEGIADGGLAVYSEWEASDQARDAARIESKDEFTLGKETP